MTKEKGPKERPPYRAGLQLLCALQLRAGAAELANAQTVLAHFRSKLAVLDNTKGNDVKTESVTPCKLIQLPLPYSVIPAEAGIQK